MVTRTGAGSSDSGEAGSVATLRCASCGGTFEMGVADADLETSRVTCARCGHVYHLESLALLASTDDLFHELTEQLAAENDIDLADAYSVLLGIMSLEQVAVSAPEASSPGVSGAGKYDPAFASAVEEGFLTPRQAFEKGNRANLAARLAERHDLSMEQALQVADNRVSLRDVVGRRNRIEIVTVPPTRRPGLRGPTRALIAVLFLAAAASGTWWVVRMANAEGPAPGTRVLTDDAGRVVEVVAPDPLAVLHAFCLRATGAGGRRFETLGLLPPALPSSRVRVGILRDPADREVLLAIPIRQEENHSLWMAGNGRAPLSPVRAPDDAAQFFRLR